MLVLIYVTYSILFDVVLYLRLVVGLLPSVYLPLIHVSGILGVYGSY